MAIKLDLNTAIKEDKKKTSNENTASAAQKKSTAKTKAEKPALSKPAQATPKSKKSPGRPKGVPVVTRSLRINADINSRLVAKQEQTGRSFNDLVNLALDAYLK